jgi:hypothetical protein
MATKSVTGTGLGTSQNERLKDYQKLIGQILDTAGRRITIVPTGDINSINNTFTFPEVVRELLVFKNGLLLSWGNDYHLLDDMKTLIFEPANIPANGDIITCQVFRSVRSLLALPN